MDLETILKDRSSGQSRIIRMTIELLKRTRRKSDRLEICRKVASVHKAMAGLRWLLKRLEEGASVSEVEAEIEEMDERCVERLSEIVDGKVVVTISRSHIVEKALLKAKHVIALESTPGKEGIELARFLRGRGVLATVFPDSAMGYAVKACDMAVVGADAVLKDGFINKTGTLPLALTAKHLGKPLYVACPKYKFGEVEFEEITDLDFEEGMLFEKIPKDLVKEFVTE